MTNAKLSKVLVAALLLGAGAVHAAAPSAVEVPGAWYADQIRVDADVRTAATPMFPSAAYEHGLTAPFRADSVRMRPSIAGSTSPFPASPNETGSML